MAAKNSKVINCTASTSRRSSLSSACWAVPDTRNFEAGLQFQYRLQHEGPQVHAGMRQFQAFRLQHQVLTGEQVEVNATGTPARAAPVPAQPIFYSPAVRRAIHRAATPYPVRQRH